MPEKRAPRKTKRTFAELFFPRRPQRILQKAKELKRKKSGTAPSRGPASAANKAYIRWLVGASMLENANKQALEYSGKSKLWQNPFARPRPRAALSMADVWYTAYPISMISAEGVSALAALGDEELWEAFARIGIRGLHTGPMKRAGGLLGWHETPSVDGHFDRISNEVDPFFGTKSEFRNLCAVAASHGGIIIDDIVPGHTGKGADFRLAEMCYGEFPGIYHMVEIEEKDWSILPGVPSGRDSVNIDADTEKRLKDDGYIIGRLPRVIFYEPGVKETNWSVTRPVRGVDGVTRRWVYLHYFKEGQPSINWLDPSFAGMKLVVGDALHSLGELGTTGLRLDANGFLGIERNPDDTPAWSEGHPLSIAANQLIAGMVRKAGGFTFQELNLSADDIKAMSVLGADLSYDFINRPAYHHALATADTEFLRLTLREAHSIGIDPASLIHALQNHDELTYELVHFWTVHKDDEYQFRGSSVKGFDLMNLIRLDLRTAVTGRQAPYNLLFSENGIACTTASFIAAVLGFRDVSELNPDDVDRIREAHLLLVMFNAWQPGVFALSGWDLSGALTLAREDVKELISDGDTRWINRGAYDLLGKSPHAAEATSGMKRATSLYGSLPEQAEDASSFASRLRDILQVRSKLSLASSHQIDVPDVSNKSLLVMVHRLPDPASTLQVTALNFSAEVVDGSIHSDSFPAGAIVRDESGLHEPAVVDELRNFSLSLGPFAGACLIIE